MRTSCMDCWQQMLTPSPPLPHVLHAASPVDVCLGVGGRVIVDHTADAADVHAASHGIRRDQGLDAALLEPQQCRRLRVWRDVAGVLCHSTWQARHCCQEEVQPAAGVCGTVQMWVAEVHTQRTLELTPSAAGRRQPAWLRARSGPAPQLPPADQQQQPDRMQAATHAPVCHV